MFYLAFLIPLAFVSIYLAFLLPELSTPRSVLRERVPLGPLAAVFETYIHVTSLEPRGLGHMGRVPKSACDQGEVV
jgi:hypothetical protein